MSKSDFQVMQEMSDNDMDIVMAPPGNFKRAQIGKDGYGELVMAVGNEQILNLEDYIPALYLVNRKQFHEIKGATQ